MRGIIFSAIFIAASLTSFGQSWINIEEGDIKSTGERYIMPTKYVISKVDNEAIYAILKSAPKESAEIDIYSSNTLVKLPLADGTTDLFRILEYAMMEPGLQIQYPNIRTYYGVSTTNPFRTVVADYTSFGFKAMITTINEGMVFIDNYQMGDISTKIIYNKKDNTRRDRWFCGVTDEDFNHSVISERSMMTGDCQLREYRLALSTNAEYTDFFIPGPSPPTAADSTAVNVGLVHSAVVTSMNRVNGVYMKEFAMRLILIANNNILYYFNTNTDGYTNNDGVAMLGQNQTKTTARIGTANFDIGHVFSTGGGGVASTSPCVAGSKARGVTGSGAPVGDAFDIDYVAHEMGHQFGANHTFASGVSNCAPPNRNNATAFEPGSGSSIMAYAGICAPENVQNNSDATFHAISLQEVKALQMGTGNCGQIINTPANTPPVVSPMPNYYVPISTPFALTISATDTDPLIYAWDQMNDVMGNVTTPPQSTNTSGPMFRNILPITSPTRYFPNLAGILLGNTSSASGWEVLPSVARTLNFRGVARDFNGLFGCSSEVNLTVSVITGTTKFEITTDNTAMPSWITGTTRTVTWSVGGTTANGINCAAVDILWTTNGGATWTTLVLDVPNDGAQEIIVPSTTTTTGRYMVRARGNVFLDINNTNITVTATGSVPTFNLLLSPWYDTVCTGQNKTYTVSVLSFSGYVTPVTLSLVGLPAGFTANFSINPVTPGSTSILTITNSSAAVATSVVGLNGVSGSINKTTNFSLTSIGGLGAFTLSTPVNNATGISLKPTFTWTAAANAATYQFQVSRKSDFSNILLSTSNLTTLTYTLPTFLVGYSEYFWRVRAVNGCGNGVWQSFKFDTESCIVQSSTNVPIAIADGATSTSNLLISDKGTINDIDVVDLEGTHTYVGDLRFTLISPSPANTSVRIWEQPCGNFANFDVNFNQAVTTPIPCPPTDGFDHPPTGAGVGTLNSFNTQNARGNWRMQMQDLATPDAGILQTWRLKTCLTNFCRLTVDSDAEKGAGSLFAAINCAANGDTIRFASTFMNDTITLFTSNIVTNKRLFIDADPAKNIHVTSTSSQPTFVTSTPNTQEGLKIRGLHIHSSASTAVGAIQNSGLLNMVDVTLYRDTAGALATIRNDIGGTNNLSGSCKIKP